jgi:hypothetical protein
MATLIHRLDLQQRKRRVLVKKIGLTIKGTIGGITTAVEEDLF